MTRPPLGLLCGAFGLALSPLYQGPAAASEFDALVARAEALVSRVTRPANSRPNDQPRFVAYIPEAQAAARRYGIPLPLVLAVAEVESAFDPRAVSAKGARGLMQVMPETARELGVDPAQLFDPAVNLDTGVRYLRILADWSEGHTATVLAAYNAGPDRVESGAPLPNETIEYVDRVAAAYPRYVRVLERNAWEPDSVARMTTLRPDRRAGRRP